MAALKPIKCIVKGCENHKHQGTFVGDLCFPCHEMLITGKLGHGNTFIHRLVKSVPEDLIDEVIKWSNARTKGTEDQWVVYLARYLKQKGWDEIAIGDFVEWGEYVGFNNEILHMTTDLPEFWSEVNYCSDRMSLDRLFRCHVMYRTLE